MLLNINKTIKCHSSYNREAQRFRESFPLLKVFQLNMIQLRQSQSTETEIQMKKSYIAATLIFYDY